MTIKSIIKKIALLFRRKTLNKWKIVTKLHGEESADGNGFAWFEGEKQISPIYKTGVDAESFLGGSPFKITNLRAVIDGKPVMAKKPEQPEVKYDWSAWNFLAEQNRSLARRRLIYRDGDNIMLNDERKFGERIREKFGEKID